MSYKGRTMFYNIPYITNGDYLSEENEKEQMEIISGLLFLNNYFYPNCVISDGKYSLEDKTEKSKILNIDPINGYSFLVIIKNRLYFCKEKISFELDINEKYYIYLDVDYDNCNNKYKLFISKKIVNHNAILLCEVDLTNNTEIINSKHKDKKYLNNIKKHIELSDNPHGDFLNQNTINVNKLFLKNEEILKTIYMDVKIEKNVLLINTKNVKFVNVMPLEDIGNFYVKLSTNNFAIYSEKNGKCRLEIKVYEDGN